MFDSCACGILACVSLTQDGRRTKTCDLRQLWNRLRSVLNQIQEHTLCRSHFMQGNRALSQSSGLLASKSSMTQTQLFSPAWTLFWSPGTPLNASGLLNKGKDQFLPGLLQKILWSPRPTGNFCAGVNRSLVLFIFIICFTLFSMYWSVSGSVSHIILAVQH